MLWETPEFKYFMKRKKDFSSDEEFLRAVLSRRHKRIVAEIIHQFVKDGGGARLPRKYRDQLMDWGTSDAPRDLVVLQQTDVLFVHFSDYVKDVDEWGHLGFEEYLAESPPWALKKYHLDPAVDWLKDFLPREIDIAVGTLYGCPWQAGCAPSPSGTGIVALPNLLRHLEPWSKRQAQLAVIRKEAPNSLTRHIAQASLPYLAHYIYDTVVVDETRAFWSSRPLELEVFNGLVGNEFVNVARDMIHFVILHEFMHILLEHPQELESRPSVERQHEMEYEADHEAANILRTILWTNGYSWQHFVDVLHTLFLLVHFGEQGLPGDSTHPTAVKRYQGLFGKESNFGKEQRLADESMSVLNETPYRCSTINYDDSPVILKQFLIPALAIVEEEGPWHGMEEYQIRVLEVYQELIEASCENG